MTVEFNLKGVSSILTEVEGQASHYEVRYPNRLAGRGSHSVQVIDAATGKAVVQRIGAHRNHRASGKLRMSELGDFQFPIRGTRPGDAIMAAIDETGACRVSYRFSNPELNWGNMDKGGKLNGIEVAVAPEAATNMNSALLLVAMSIEWLRSYFVSPVSSG